MEKNTDKPTSSYSNHKC